MREYARMKDVCEGSAKGRRGEGMIEQGYTESVIKGQNNGISGWNTQQETTYY